MIYLATLAGILMIGGLALAVSLARNMAPSNKRKRLEVQRMKDDMDKWITELIPIDKEEMETFSLGQDKQVVRRGITTTAKGIFTTIYHEPVLAYSYRQYLGNNEKPNAILYARTAEHEYVYWVKKGKATLFIDDQEVGQISTEGTLLGKRTGKKIAQLSKDAPKMLPVTVGGREVGSLTKKEATGKKGLYERAFEFLQEDINPKEEQLFLALAIQELVSRSTAK